MNAQLCRAITIMTTSRDEAVQGYTLIVSYLNGTNWPSPDTSRLN